MRYYKLLFDYENDTDKVLCYTNPINAIDQYCVQLGRLIDSWDDDFTLYYNPDEGNVFTDYLGNSLGWFIISTRLKKVLEKIEVKGVQYLPITIKNIKDLSSTNEYYVANVCNMCNGLDFDNSKYDEVNVDKEQKTLFIEFHVLKIEKITGMHIFKLNEDQFPIFISEQVKHQIEDNNISGCDFLEVKVSDNC